jgi:hypothetical protein
MRSPKECELNTEPRRRRNPSASLRGEQLVLQPSLTTEFAVLLGPQLVRLRYDRQVSARRSGAAEHQSARHVKSWFGAPPCRRATKLTVVPGSNVSSTIRTFLRRYPAPTALNRRDNLNSIRQHASHSLVDEIWDLNHRAGTMTHDYKRHGTTTLFAALNVLDGTVIGRNMQRHRHQEFIRCLNAIEAQLLLGRVVHVRGRPCSAGSGLSHVTRRAPHHSSAKGSVSGYS